jgi:hypothetical protein
MTTDVFGNKTADDLNFDIVIFGKLNNKPWVIDDKLFRVEIGMTNFSGKYAFTKTPISITKKCKDLESGLGYTLNKNNKFI